MPVTNQWTEEDPLLQPDEIYTLVAGKGITVTENSATKEVTIESGTLDEDVLDLGYISGANTLDLSQHRAFRMILGGNVAITFSGLTASPNIDKLTAVILYVIQDGTGGFTISFPGSTIRTVEGQAMIPSTAANTRVIYYLLSIDHGATWDAWLLANTLL